MTIQLPTDLLPCIDDYPRLRVIADYVGERGDTELERHLRWVAHEWERYRGLKRRDVEVGMTVWARYSSSGWSRAVVAKVTPRKIVVEFPHRKVRHWTKHAVQQAERAWWDLEPRGEWQGTRYKRPKPRKGYGTQKNAALAAALCFDQAARVSKAKSEPMGQLLLWGTEDGQ
jgi:hypothetical protein